MPPLRFLPKTSGLFEAEHRSSPPHNRWVHLIPMMEEEKEAMEIHYSCFPSRLKMILIANSPLGICCMAYADNREEGVSFLRNHFPHANIQEDRTPLQERVFAWTERGKTPESPIPVHVCGTEFQLFVWQLLLEIPEGEVSSYSLIAEALNQENASRAVGTAVGANPVAWLIPCHRVIQKSGSPGGYRWGLDRKLALLRKEQGN